VQVCGVSEPKAPRCRNPRHETWSNSGREVTAWPSRFELKLLRGRITDDFPVPLCQPFFCANVIACYYIETS
jgi:hypothetical protein